MKLHQRSCYLTSFALLLTAGMVLAEPKTTSPIIIELAAPVLLDDLEQVRGLGGVMDVTTNNNANLEATLTDNQAINNVNGFNIIDNGSFTEASGVFSIIQNTGNNVIIQDSTIITVTITPD